MVAHIVMGCFLVLKPVTWNISVSLSHSRSHWKLPELSIVHTRYPEERRHNQTYKGLFTNLNGIETKTKETEVGALR